MQQEIVYSLIQGWITFLRASAQENFSRVHWKFEQKKGVLNSYIICINYCYIIYYNYLLLLLL
jgi:hypothetical protein